MSSPLFRLFLVAGISVSVALAQQAEKKSARTAAKRSGQQSPASQAAGGKTPQPPPEMHKLVKALSGTWSIREKYEPDEWTPNGGVGEGTEVWRPGPGGFTLIEEYHSKNPAGETFGLSLAWWDDKAQRYQSLWCVNSNPQGCQTGFTLAWEGNKIVVTSEFERDGKDFAWHEVVSDITPTSFTQTADIGPIGGKSKRWLTIHATKMKPRRN